MAHCPGCGADIWRTGDTFGHILGCGVLPSDPDQIEDQQCPWTKEGQRRILAQALERVLGERQPTRRADELARALQELLSDVAQMTEDARERYMGHPSGRPDEREPLMQQLRLMQRRIDQLEERVSRNAARSSRESTATP